MKKAAALMRRIGALEYSVKSARRLAWMWGTMMLLNALTAALYILLPVGTWQVGYHLLLLAFNAWMFRHYAMKLASAKRTEERQEWEHAMFAEWSR